MKLYVWAYPSNASTTAIEHRYVCICLLRRGSGWVAHIGRLSWSVHIMLIYTILTTSIIWGYYYTYVPTYVLFGQRTLRRVFVCVCRWITFIPSYFYIISFFTISFCDVISVHFFLSLSSLVCSSRLSFCRSIRQYRRQNHQKRKDRPTVDEPKIGLMQMSIEHMNGMNWRGSRWQESYPEWEIGQWKKKKLDTYTACQSLRFVANGRDMNQNDKIHTNGAERWRNKEKCKSMSMWMVGIGFVVGHIEQMADVTMFAYIRNILYLDNIW